MGPTRRRGHSWSRARATDCQRANALLGRVAAGTPVAGEDFILSKDGRHVLVSATPAADQVLVVLQDVTPLVQRVEEQAREREAVERAMRGKMRFFAAASHDLRQPLQAIALFVSALEPHVTAPAARPILQSMKTSLRTMEDMFNGLLDMSRLEAGVLKAAPQVFIIGDVLEALEQEFAPQVAPGKVELRVVLSSQSVRSDPNLLTRILRNLMANAVRYTDRSRILLGCRRRGRSLRVEVWDTGCGIPEDQRLAIFQEFYRGGAEANQCRAGGGLGLGLSIVQGLARLLGHRLDVRSQVGKGSVFAVEMPLAEAPATVQPEEHAAQRPQLDGCTVLVIDDDDDDIQEGLRLLLSEWGCRPVVAPGGDAAVQALSRQRLRPDVVLADLRLCDGDGLAAVRQVMDHVGGWVPTVVLTGVTEGGDGIELAGHHLPVLRKPMDPARLAHILGEVLHRN